MRTYAVRLYGKKDLRLEAFDLPPLREDEILAHVISDSLCMSSYKLAIQGEEHKRVPKGVKDNPVIIGHEFCGEIVEVGSRWKDRFSPGQKFVIQPALNYNGSMDSPGYSYPYIGGDATYIVIPKEVMEMDCLLPYTGEAYYWGSLAEPVSCVVGAFRANYHFEQGSYEHEMGIKAGGSMLILGGCGPMGLGAIDLALHGPMKPRLLVVTDIDPARLERASRLFPAEAAREKGVEFHVLDPSKLTNPDKELLRLTKNEGFDDVFVMAPVRELVEQADRLLGKGGCLNFFAGPTDPQFSALVNFYEVHYSGHHLVATSGGNTEDMRIALDLMSKGRIDPSLMITHVGGLDAVVDTTLNLPKIPGGKKLIYTNIRMPLTALADFEQLGTKDPLFFELHKLVQKHNGLWNKEAERYLLSHATPIDL
jgi:threonine dehydrogenase-like Zn-dependent dehydrogenase